MYTQTDNQSYLLFCLDHNTTDIPLLPPHPTPLSAQLRRHVHLVVVGGLSNIKLTCTANEGTACCWPTILPDDVVILSFLLNS